ncbi:hypothetical protein G7Y89_g12754 [Cudoniella acicularis]|uniref:Uncharacterized protein n=1 Tax=Cudoniella acicularis TaxID=354080 RepID=A0A8H4VZC5_9HELO|nr:hypothetical protein G7Y89_g12754 [Cudoniella acicularis]
MTKLPKSKARSIGVSSRTIDHLEALIKATFIVPAVNQAFGNNMFNVPLLFSHLDIKAVAVRLSTEKGETIAPTQVLLAWAEIGGHSVIPKSVTASRIVENFKEIELSPSDVAQIEQIGKQQRRFIVPYIANKPHWDVNIFADEQEKAASHQVII